MDGEGVLGVRADAVDIGSLPRAELPAEEADGRIETLNKMGSATKDLSWVSQEFVAFAAQSVLPVLDGGAAFGAATVAALEQGASVVANDVCQGHLDFIVASAASAVGAAALSRLYVKGGALPDGVVFPPDSLGAVHLSRVMHFFAPEEFVRMFANAARWLAPGGKMFVATMSPFHHLAHGLDEAYEQNKAANAEWAGVIGNFADSYGEGYPGSAPETGLLAVDTSVVERVALENHFRIERLELFGGPEGRDYVGAVLVVDK